MPNIEALIDGDGEITIGTAGPNQCVATAADEDHALVMLVRRDGETLVELLVRLEAAIEMAHENGDYIDEINNGRDDRL